jgi:ribosome-associated protein
LTALIRKAATPPKPRRKTRPPKRSIEKRIQNKKNRSKIKKLRQTHSDD